MMNYKNRMLESEIPKENYIFSIFYWQRRFKNHLVYEIYEVFYFKEKFKKMTIIYL